MSFHGNILFTISVLAAFVQVEFQSKSWSPFETHYWIMSTFFVVLSIYVVASAAITMRVQAQNPQNDNRVSSEISHICGALASILLLIIILPVLGWIFLVIWTLYFVKTAYELVNAAIIELLDTLSKAVHGRFDHKEEHRLPV